MDSVVTVVTAAPAADRRLCSLDAVKAELGISGADQDSLLDDLRDQASAAAASFCGRVFAEEVVRETWRNRARVDGALVLARHPVSAVASVTEGGEELIADDYEMDGNSGMLWRLSGDDRACWPAAKLVVEYTAGWRVPDQTSPTLPADVSRAAVLLAASMYHNQGRDRALRSESVDGVMSASYLDPRAGAEQMPPEVAGLLAPYRLVAV
jgi:uncharacterized phiE125 gp8 family phage protein